MIFELVSELLKNDVCFDLLNVILLILKIVVKKNLRAEVYSSLGRECIWVADPDPTLPIIESLF